MTTTTDWRTLAPGRELDAIVAERCMGWGWMTRDRPEVLPRQRWLAPPEEVGDFGHVRPADMSEPMEEPWWLDDGFLHIGPNEWRVPAYSTDLAAAWLVVGEMERRGLSVSLCCERAGGPWSCALWHKNDDHPAADEIHVGPAPHAIVLAALAALDSETRGEG